MQPRDIEIINAPGRVWDSLWTQRPRDIVGKRRGPVLRRPVDKIQSSGRIRTVQGHIRRLVDIGGTIFGRPEGVPSSIREAVIWRSNTTSTVLFSNIGNFSKLLR